MSWIQQVPYEEASGRLRAGYERVRGPGGEVDNVLAVHSLRPHTLQGRLARYKSVLHQPGVSPHSCWESISRSHHSGFAGLPL